MLATKPYSSQDKIPFDIYIDSIQASRRSPNEYFCIQWSVVVEDQLVGCSFIMKYTDPFLFQHGIRPWRDIKTDEIVSKEEIAKALMEHLVIVNVGHGVQHVIQFFFADRPDGEGPFDGVITWSHAYGLSSH